jgi:two-component system, NtrC family, sensor kinase
VLTGEARWHLTTKVPMLDGAGNIVGLVGMSRNVTARKQTEEALRSRNSELVELNHKLSQMQQQLLQSEKLASIGQLAAGVAHEINNPIGYIFSNFGTLEKYLVDAFEVLAAYEDAEALLLGTPVAARLKTLRERVDLEYLKEDIPALMAQSKEGIERVRKIVQDLKDFSRVDARQEWEWADLHRGIDSTLNIVSNEIKYKADVVKRYGTLPEVECLPSELNQVFMNLLVNAAHAIDAERGMITVRTQADGAEVWVEVEDNGCGIPAENLSRIFDPFFTTKPVGKGTGLGLSLAYGIVQKHAGRIEVESEIGRGTRFRVIIPRDRSVQAQP